MLSVHNYKTIHFGFEADTFIGHLSYNMLRSMPIHWPLILLPTFYGFR